MCIYIFCDCARPSDGGWGAGGGGGGGGGGGAPFNQVSLKLLLKTRLGPGNEARSWRADEDAVSDVIISTRLKGVWSHTECRWRDSSTYTQ